MVCVYVVRTTNQTIIVLILPTQNQNTKINFQSTTTITATKSFATADNSLLLRLRHSHHLYSKITAFRPGWQNQNNLALTKNGLLSTFSVAAGASIFFLRHGCNTKKLQNQTSLTPSLQHMFVINSTF